ncbi:hypothetical protein ACP93_14670 [Xanthomonas sp. NCPPB 1128]|nr:hypothetical protein ACP93_14670 [Xanthomonas sp. NCPPB 1128]
MIPLFNVQITEVDQVANGIFAPSMQPRRSATISIPSPLLDQLYRVAIEEGDLPITWRNAIIARVFCQST